MSSSSAYMAASAQQFDPAIMNPAIMTVPGAGVPDVFQEEHSRLRAQKAFSSPEWEDHFVDYDRLKMHLDSMQSMKGNSKDFTKACELFWCILKADIDNVNTFYLKKDGDFLHVFQEFKFDKFTRSEKMDDKSVLCLFSKMLHDLNAEQYSTITRQSELPECCQNLGDLENADPE
eukprot:51156_1